MPQAPHDVDLGQWLNGMGFHPADTEAKQLGHEVARQQIAWLGQLLHQLLPAGRDKSLVFTALEDVLMRANRSLALGGGPNGSATLEQLRRLAVAGPLPQDPRVEQYKAEQRGEQPAEENPAQGVLDDFQGEGFEQSTLVTTIQSGRPDAIQVEIHAEPGKYVQLGVICTDEEQVSGAIMEGTPERPFNGFWFTLNDVAQVNDLLVSLDVSARHAFR